MLSVKGCFCHYFYILNHSYNMAEAEAEVAVAEPEKSHWLTKQRQSKDFMFLPLRYPTVESATEFILVTVKVIPQRCK